MKKIKVGAVSYLNTKPLIYGLQQGMMNDQVDLVMEYPSKIAAMLLDNSIDIGLVPVAILPQMKEYHISSDYCIGATGPVASVCLFSEVPVNEIKTVLLDYQSRTSVALLKVLLKEYWKIDPIFLPTTSNYQSQIQGTTAGLVIGDRALEQRKHSTYIYDLAETWLQHTGLPFIFAAWISNQKLHAEFIESFNAANLFGLEKLDEIIIQNNYPVYNLKTYYTKNISYDLDLEKRKGLDMFLSKLIN